MFRHYNTEAKVSKWLRSKTVSTKNEMQISFSNVGRSSLFVRSLFSLSEQLAMRPFIVGLLVFALSLQVSHCLGGWNLHCFPLLLVCRVCSYFPNYFAYLKDKLREKINDAQNDDTSQAKLQTIFSIDYAADKPNITCLNESDTSVHFEGCNALLNACVRQVVFSLDPRKKEPAIVYSCAKIAKVGLFQQAKLFSV